MKSPVLYLLLIGLMVFSSCENDIATVNRLTAQKEANVETGTDIEILYSNNGKIKAKVNAPLVKRYKSEKKPYTEMPEGVKMTFFDDTMHIQSTLDARYGMIDEKTNEMIARNNVEVVSILGDRLNTDELIWNEQSRKIYSDKFVKIQTKDEILYGNGFESNEDLTHYKIRQIRGRVKLKENTIPE